MGTISDKLTYLNDTKGLLKQKINNLGGDITDQTTFRQYADKLQTIYDNLPKTSYAEGSNITLSNTLKGKLDFENDIVGYGDTEQNGTPTPTTPIPINTVTGEQEVTISNVNIFTHTNTYTRVGVTCVFNNSTLVINGTTIADGGFTTIGGMQKFFTLEAGTYKLSFKKLSGSFNMGTYSKPCNVIIRNLDTSTNIIDSGYAEDTIYTITLTNKTNIGFNLYQVGAGVSYSDYTIGIQLEEGNIATDFVEHQEQNYTINLGNIELAKIGTYRDYIWTDRSTGKWYKHSTITKVVFNGTEDWSVTQTTAGYRFTTTISKNVVPPPNSQTVANVYCNRLKAGSLDTIWVYGGNYIGVFSTGVTIAVCLTDLTINTVDKFKTFLRSNNLIAYFQLATPTDTEITDTLLINQLEECYNMSSISGTTIIETSGNLPILIKVRALKGN